MAFHIDKQLKTQGIGSRLLSSLETPPYEVVAFASVRRGQHKTFITIWKGFSIDEGLLYYRLTLDIIQMYAKEGAQVLLRGHERWYHRAILKNWKFQEEVNP